MPQDQTENVSKDARDAAKQAKLEDKIAREAAKQAKVAARQAKLDEKEAREFIKEAKMKAKQEKNARKQLQKDRRRANRVAFLQKLKKGGVAIEIGVWKAEFSPSIIEIIQPEKFYLVDPWISDDAESHKVAFTGRTENTEMDDIHDEVCAQFKEEIDSGLVEVLREFSIPVLERFDDQSINFAYVDGDHSYNGVKSDLNALLPKMAPGGIMAFDDYHRRGWWKDDVIRAINEFLGEHPTLLRVHALSGAQIALEVAKTPKEPIEVVVTKITK